MASTAFMDPRRAPTDTEITEALGPAAPLWELLTSFLAVTYAIEPTLVAPSRSYGWEVKYRKGGKTLVSLTPDLGRFTALVVLGAKETVAAGELDLGEHVRAVFDEARQLRDGRWLFVPVESEQDVEDVEALLAVKRRPRATRVTPAG